MTETKIERHQSYLVFVAFYSMTRNEDIKCAVRVLFLKQDDTCFQKHLKCNSACSIPVSKFYIIPYRKGRDLPTEETRSSHKAPFCIHSHMISREIRSHSV